MRLKDKVAIITGSASGIGKSAALVFAREGAKVVVCDVNEENIEKTVADIKALGAEAMGIVIDVSKAPQVEKMVQKVHEHFGRIDILVNNAGITRDALLIKLSEENWDKVIEVNLKGVFLCTQAVAKKMVTQGKGKIINTSSVVGVYGNIGQTNYAAAKAGIIGMTKTWAKELGRKNVCVNAVTPGFIQTEMTAGLPEKVLTMMKDKTPLGRLGVPEDVANLYLFLASDESDYVNGQVIGVDGGMVI
ncbi:MAG: 3-oxoacyl-[acyl-carrier-protein] reductase [Candidatus Eremiobacteraeota bacterium]|nr:3-oxoacyl-[acyl-carrier-protein] reductase [Candidatus Eremiobacteraeota bacterium]